MAGPTMGWLIDAPSMPSMSAMKMLRVGGARPGALAARGGLGGAVESGRLRGTRRAGWAGRGVRGYSLGLLWHATHLTSIVQSLQNCSHCRLVARWVHEHGPADRRVVRPARAQEARDPPSAQP